MLRQALCLLLVLVLLLPVLAGCTSRKTSPEPKADQKAMGQDLIKQAGEGKAPPPAPAPAPAPASGSSGG